MLNPSPSSSLRIRTRSKRYMPPSKFYSATSDVEIFKQVKDEKL
jgi:hypothetical protein